MSDNKTLGQVHDMLVCMTEKTEKMEGTIAKILVTMATKEDLQKVEQKIALVHNELSNKLSAEIGSVRSDLEAVHTKLDEHTKMHEDHKKTLAEHTQILEKHSKTLDVHTKILDSHTKTLEKHSQAHAEQAQTNITIRADISSVHSLLITTKVELEKKMDDNNFALENKIYTLQESFEKTMAATAHDIKNTILSHVDGFVGLHKRLETEYYALRSRVERIAVA